jgi:hypothetical protein
MLRKNYNSYHFTSLTRTVEYTPFNHPGISTIGGSFSASRSLKRSAEDFAHADDGEDYTFPSASKKSRIDNDHVRARGFNHEFGGFFNTNK